MADITASDEYLHRLVPCTDKQLFWVWSLVVAKNSSDTDVERYCTLLAQNHGEMPNSVKLSNLIDDDLCALLAEHGVNTRLFYTDASGKKVDLHSYTCSRNDPQHPPQTFGTYVATTGSGTPAGLSMEGVEANVDALIEARLADKEKVEADWTAMREAGVVMSIAEFAIQQRFPEKFGQAVLRHRAQALGLPM